jgi:hypothetical protein
MLSFNFLVSLCTSVLMHLAVCNTIETVFIIIIIIIKFQYIRHLRYFSLQDNFICARNYWDQRRGFRRNRSTADHSAFDICLRKNGSRMMQIVWFVYLKRGYDAVRREVLFEVFVKYPLWVCYLPAARQFHENAIIRNLRRTTYRQHFDYTFPFGMACNIEKSLAISFLLYIRIFY